MSKGYMRHLLKRRVVMVRLIVAASLIVSLALGIAVHVISSHATATPPNTSHWVTTYTLITGERIAVTRLPGSKPAVSLVPGSSGTGNIEVLTSGQHLYVLPYYAAGYIGAPLSIDLFDVTALPADTTTAAASPPQVAVSYTAGSTASAEHLPPGLSKAASGSITVTDRKKFGAALAQQWLADKRGDTAQMFAGIARIAPTRISAGSAAAATPASGKLFTVTVKGFDRLGRRDAFDFVNIENVDNLALYASATSFFRGTLAFSVPAGHYTISSIITTLYPDASFDVTLAAEPEVTVTHDVTVILDAHKGNAISVTTPLVSTPAFRALTYQRVDPTDRDSELFFATDSRFDSPPTALYATPTAPVSLGTVDFVVSSRLVNPQSGLVPGSPGSYLYDLKFPFENIIPSDLAITVRQDQLAMIDSQYHSSLLGRAQLEERVGFFPWERFGVFQLGDLVAPEARREYVTARPDLPWQHVVAPDPASSFPPIFGVMLGSVASFSPAQQVQDDWTAQPMAPGIQQEPVFPQLCPVCRSGDTLNIVLYPFSDNGGHYMQPDFTTTENLTFYQDGTSVGQSSFGEGASFPMSPQPAHYTLVDDSSKQSAVWPTSTHVHTEWAFSSQERAPDPLPPGWECLGDGCSFEPLLFTHYRTSAGLDDVVPAGGPADLEVTVSHQRGAAAPPITSFSAQVSYDEGQTWQSIAATDGGNGVYHLRYMQPALNQTNGFAALHIQAADAAGSAIDQTILRAYPLAVTAPAQVPTPSGTGGASGPQPACATPSVAPFARCMALVNVRPAGGGGGGGDGGPTQPSGLGPSDLQSAYQLSPTAGQGRTVAIVDAFDDPNAEADLGTYRANYGLPACTSTNGCFTKVNQRGDPAGFPSPDPGWGVEISLDLDAVSATCPACHILLIEADSSSILDLAAAVQTAQRRGANVISNSYGTPEFSGEQTFEHIYRDLNVPFVVASGDFGYGNQSPVGAIAYPAASQFAVAVGGTTLARADNGRGWTESAWGIPGASFLGGATSGCSAYIHKPGWQKDNLCSMRTVADVAAVADPATGLAVYDTFVLPGWVQVGGTSLSAPIIASVFAMAGDGSTVRYASDLYNHASDLFDVTSGVNGNCNGTYLCTALPGYDGPTGLGTPNGTNAFH